MVIKEKILNKGDIIRATFRAWEVPWLVVSLPDVHEVPSSVPHKPREVVQACHVNARDRGKGIGISKSLLTTKQAGDILSYVKLCETLSPKTYERQECRRQKDRGRPLSAANRGAWRDKGRQGSVGQWPGRPEWHGCPGERMKQLMYA